MRRLVVSTLLFLSAALSLAAELKHNNYYWLDKKVKKFVDQAIATANGQLNYGHLNYEGIGLIAEVSSRQVRIDVRLRATTCRKDPGKSHRPECAFKQLKVRCMVCGRCPDFFHPSIDCVRRKDEQTRHAVWDRQCKPAPPLGGSYSLLSSGGLECPRQNRIMSHASLGYADAPEAIMYQSIIIHDEPPYYDYEIQSIQVVHDGLPTISVSPSINGVSEGRQQGRQVFHGSNFTISCSQYMMEPILMMEPLLVPVTNTSNSTELLQGFYLTFDSGSNTTDRHAQSYFDDRKPGPADFLFPAADHTHQGIYRCVYGVTLNGQVYGEEQQSWPLSLSVVVTDKVPAISVFPSMEEVPEYWLQQEEEVGERLLVLVSSSFTIICSIQDHRPHSSFLLTVSSGSNVEHSHTQPCVNGSATLLFPVADHTHQGFYTCVYSVTIDGHVYSRHSEPLSLSVVATDKVPAISVFPSIRRFRYYGSLQERQVVEGSIFTISCSIQDQHPHSSFFLTVSSGSNVEHSHTQPCVNGSATFLFPVADHTHQGFYTCVYNVTIDGHVYTRPSETLSLSVTLTDLTPAISVSPSINRVSEGQQQGQQVLHGSSFTISCSLMWREPIPVQVTDRLLEGFYLTFDSGSNTTDRHAQAGSDDFLFLAADHTHQGNYTCFYGVTINGQVYGEQWRSELLSLSVIVTDKVPAISVFPSIKGVPEHREEEEEEEEVVVWWQQESRNRLPEDWKQERWQVLEEGSVFTISCSIQDQRPHSSFHLTVSSGSNIEHSHTQPCVNGSAHFLFPVADHTHQGVYTCVYSVTIDGHVYTRHSKPLPLSVFPTPAIRVFLPSINGVSEGRQQGQQQVLEEGSIFTISCSVQEELPHSSFHLTFRSGADAKHSSFHLTFRSGADAKHSIKQPNVNGSADFPFPAAEYAHQGVYECVHDVTVDGYVYTRRSEPLSLAVRERERITKGPSRPTISVFPSINGQVLEGLSFTITCSTQQHHPNSSFYLTFGREIKEEKPCVSRSVSFLFPEADHTHQGDYRCVYVVRVDGRISRIWSECLTLAVTAASVDSFHDDYVEPPVAPDDDYVEYDN